MSNEFLQAADDANRLLAGFAAVKTVADAFAKVGGLQQAQGEAETALAGLQVQVGAAKDELAQASQALAEIQAQTEAARGTAQTLIADATSEAEAIRTTAKATAEAARDETAQWVIGELARVADEVAQATAARDAVAAETAALQAKLEALQAQAKQLLG